ncbi:acyltransferase [Chitinophaga vietnamensis]|uniref:acyltransferase n=1 Tax=Chitinophaga vietnamensis TaxID=2593957 RepID=UPI0011775E7D|nr:acyltransferase [Chitinophaga vietnamensis]
MSITISKLRRKWIDTAVKYRLRARKDIQVLLGENIRFVDRPIIKLVKGTRLHIGKNVVINSDRIGYHLNMNAPCKLLLDRAGGEIHIGDNTRIHGSCLHAFQKITIGRNCLIAANSQIMDGNGHDLSFPDVSQRIHTRGSVKPVTIADNVWIGTNVVVLPGVTIGEGSVISANSVVHKDIPPMCVAGGNPAKVIKQY